MAAAESVPKVLVGVLVPTSAWLPPQAVRREPVSNKAARGRRKRIGEESKIVNRSSTAKDGKLTGW